MKRLIICVLAVFGTSAPILADSPAQINNTSSSVMAGFINDSRDSTNLLIRTAPEAKVMQQDEKCCKICTKGKACGNTCISRSYQCHQPPGCACDG